MEHFVAPFFIWCYLYIDQRWSLSTEGSSLSNNGHNGYRNDNGLLRNQVKEFHYSQALLVGCDMLTLMRIWNANTAEEERAIVQELKLNKGLLPNER